MIDLISRQAAIDAFKPYADYESNRTNADWVRRIELVLHDLPSAQPVDKDINVSCKDAISRQAALDEAEEWLDCYYEDDNEDIRTGIKLMMRSLNRLPSVHPEPSQVARDIATIIENEQDMRVIERNNMRCKIDSWTLERCGKSRHDFIWMDKTVGEMEEGEHDE